MATIQLGTDNAKVNRRLRFSAVRRTSIVDTISFLFIFLFVYAAISKLTDFDKFQVQLGQSPMLTGFASWISWFIPAIELIISLMLATSRFKYEGLYASFSLMTMFTAYIITITKFSTFIPCSCGGILQHMSWNQHFIFNIAFVALGAVAILLHKRSYHTESS